MTAVLMAGCLLGPSRDKHETPHYSDFHHASIL